MSFIGIFIIINRAPRLPKRLIYQNYHIYRYQSVTELCSVYTFTLVAKPM
jgi:hypothetical protein